MSGADGFGLAALGLSWACDWRPPYPARWAAHQGETCKKLPDACDRAERGRLCTRYPVHIPGASHAWEEIEPGRWRCPPCGFERRTSLIKDGSRHARPHAGYCPEGPYVPGRQRGELRTWWDLPDEERAAVERGELAPVAFFGPSDGYRPLWPAGAMRERNPEAGGVDHAGG